MFDVNDWPSLRSYDGDHLRRIAMPLGGIGTGCITLGGRGDLRDWEIMNRPARGFRPSRAFFAVHAMRPDGSAITRALEGPIDPADFEGPDGAFVPNHGLPRFRHCRFEAAYPLARVVLDDPDVPLAARLEAFNPLIPGDADASGLPVAIVRVRLTNLTDESLSIGVASMLTNFIGTDGTEGAASQNRNVFRADAAMAGLGMSSDGVPTTAPGWGTLALVVARPDVRHTVSHRAAWPETGWNGDLLAAWNDFSADGRFDQVPPPQNMPNAPAGSLAVSFTLPPRSSDAVTFVIAWHFPNRLSWSPGGKARFLNNGRCASGEPIIGNYYTTRFPDAWAAASHLVENLPALERQTVAFTRAFCNADLPTAVKEAALFNLSTLRTQTCFRTPDGTLFGWEGVYERHGSCLGSCTHVWNYELAVPYVFANLARSMREVEFLHATRPDGHMSFRVHLPLAEYATESGLAAADGQAGCLIKLYREWRLSGDDAWLRSLWPRARAALAFCWTVGGWDADRDGVMEGCQHNTMDVEYYGPNPQMTGWYLGALLAGEAMAGAMGDDDFAGECRRLFDSGSRWMDANLFNGDYYEHHVRPPASPSEIAPGLRHESMGAKDLNHPAFQLGAGCLVDQLVGPAIAKASGLGALLDPAHVRTTLASILRHNRRNGFHDHFNPMRSYVLGDETALLMASYPRGRRPAQPFPYHNEVMTGFEYAAALSMLQEGLVDEGVRVITDIRARYDGRSRNPFDEAECGRHYARAMCSWGAVLALTGFDYDARAATMRFAAPDKPVNWFWSTGSAWGTIHITPAGEADAAAELIIGGGTLRLTTLYVGSQAIPIQSR